MIRLAAALTLIATQVGAQEIPCAPKEDAIRQLYEKYGETLQSGGLVEGGSVFMMLFANKETGTWTLTTLAPNGTVCLAVEGENYIADFHRKPNL